MPAVVCPTDIRLRCTSINTGDPGVLSGTLSNIQWLNKRIIRTMNDFPAPTNNFIRLEPDTEYNITGVGLVSSFPFVCDGNCAFTGLWEFGPTQLTYTGTGSMFTINDGSFDMERIRIGAPNATVFTMNNTLPIGGFRLLGVLVDACAKYGVFTEVDINIADSGVFVVADGMTISNTNRLISLREFGFNIMQPGCLAIDIGSSTPTVLELINVIFGASGPGASTAISGLANSGNFLPGRSGTVSSCEFDTANGVVPLQNITTDDTRWFFRDNTNLADTFIRAINTIQNNATATVIAALNTPVPVAGTWAIQNNSQIVQGAANTSQLVYNSTADRSLQIAQDINASFLGSAGSPDYRLLLYKNGSPTGAFTKFQTTTTVNQNANISWLEVTAPGDTYELYIEQLNGVVANLTLEDGTQRFLGDL